MTNCNTQALPAGAVITGKVYTYTIEKVLGQGAFGITYLATTNMKGPLGEVSVHVAVKEFFAKDLDSRGEGGTVTARTDEGIAYRYARAFQRESENLSKMKHPGIVKVLEAFDANGTYYYSMEFLSGGSLDDKVKGVGMPEAEALPMIKRIGEAVAFMHERKMMHLDLKPKNVMLKGDNSPVVIDFGLSKQYDSEGEPESSSSIGLGTPGYAPLEQANQSSGRVFQPTLDIYALAATLYKMLTGKTPPTASAILEEGFPEADLKAKGVSEQTILAILKAMRPIRKDRPQSVGEFLSLLDPVEIKVDDEEEDTKVKEYSRSELPPVMYGPPPVEEQEVRGRPKKWLWALLAGIVICAVALAVIFGGGWHHVGEMQGVENGHEWVDLGLSVKWATCNVGAGSPSDYGNYYAWGETSTKSDYSWSNLKYCTDSSGDYFKKYISSGKSQYWRGSESPDDKTRLELSDDAARQNWGGKWRTPSKAEWEELNTKCTWTWTTQGGKNGYKVTGKNRNGIFLPAGGYRAGGSLYGDGSIGYYWSYSLNAPFPRGAWTGQFYSGGHHVGNCYRDFGLPVRPVHK